MTETESVAILGGIYSNHLALEAALADIRRRDIERIYCLGDLGAFGPHPDRVFPLLREAGVQTLQGNYDNSIGNRLEDCQCGYTDPRDNHFAQISYAYTLANTADANKDWMRALPETLRIEIGGRRALLCHGSPRQMNEFLWESMTPDHFLDRLFADYDADVILATHTGLKWRRSLPGGREFVNAGVLGRPENDGTTRVWYTIVSAPTANGAPAPLGVEFVPVAYDHAALAAQMRAESLPPEFIATIETGWWTTCLEILPAKERRKGRF